MSPEETRHGFIALMLGILGSALLLPSIKELFTDPNVGAGALFYILVLFVVWPCNLVAFLLGLSSIKKEKGVLYIMGIFGTAIALAPLIYLIIELVPKYFS